ncbi:late expression factor 8 [Adoxophyes honmai nucleopolyhedrovirus]|uniref:DNA-directed RNA polymerase n=1 Tax=Adoxophyes honmai nucleopolyhedrovirus TaxID=224399 RepID=Q80LP7_NPVAH|nr:late expression factor 8 [Adoxophyes honmai nucleopolyhedrovirus]BAC67300.1 late expression factor 8 [Adoxophyes honmai nucleopolyhedrovirus]
MTDVIEDFNNLYSQIQNQYGFSFYLNCSEKCNNKCTLKYLLERKSYFCCAVDNNNRCVLHKCVVVIFGTWLDLMFRSEDDDNVIKDFKGTFMIDGRNLSFPNIMMNNNILIHNFYDKLYSKNCRRMFLYGNVDEEKNINRAIQLVYDDKKNVLFARDVYARDYIVSEPLNSILDIYLKNSGKWEPLNFLFDYHPKQSKNLMEQIKEIMCSKINYSIDNLANKIIYKHVYLMEIIYRPILKSYQNLFKNKNNELNEPKRKKMQIILFPKECKKIVDIIVNGKLIYAVSKTFSKQRKNFINYQDNSSNNNIEITPPHLKYRIGNEVVRITNETMRQDMLMQKNDFIKFVDSFFHGEMTVAGKKFFLCRDVRLPSIDYEMVANKFVQLMNDRLVHKNDSISTELNDKILFITFNDRPTIFSCFRSDLYKIFYVLKHKSSPIELKLANNILFVNHHEGMIMLKKKIILKNQITINVLLTPYEYHNKLSIINSTDDVGRIVEKNDVTCLMSKLVQYYYKNYTHIYSTIPTPKLIVSLTNLKNAMPIMPYPVSIDNLPIGNSAVVSNDLKLNNKMFKLWTIVRDSKLMTAEDPYIVDVKLPVRLYNNKINKVKGKLLNYSKCKNPIIKFMNNTEKNNCVEVEGGNMLYMAGTVVSNVKIGWIYDGKRYKIESCKNKNFYVSKVYFYFRQINNQIIEKLESSMNIFNDIIFLKLVTITSTNNLDGVKICGLHGQKGVVNGAEDLTEWMAEDGTCAQICLSPISYLSRQTNFTGVETKYVVKGGDFSNVNAKRYPIYNIPYMIFNNTPENIFKEFIKINHTGHEKVEGTRLDQWTINQSFAGNRWSEGLQFVRGGSNLPIINGEYNVMTSLLHCNNTIIQ